MILINTMEEKSLVILLILFLVKFIKDDGVGDSDLFSEEVEEDEPEKYHSLYF